MVVKAIIQLVGNNVRRLRTIQKITIEQLAQVNRSEFAGGCLV